MAEHERVPNGKQGNLNQKHRTPQTEYKPSAEKSPIPDTEKPSLTETPFVPRIEDHAAILSRPPFSVQRQELIMRLHQAYGNSYVRRLVKSMQIQAKLTVSAPNDTYEQEADRAAEQVVRKVNSQVQCQDEEEELQTKHVSGIQRQEEEELQAKSGTDIQRQLDDEEEELQTKRYQVQRQDEEEELQTKPVSGIQRQEEEELQAKSGTDIQRQLEDEEEELQTKRYQVQRQDEEEELQMQCYDNKSAEVSENLEARINSARGSGQPLPDKVQESMGQAFKADFSGIRTHTDPEADALSRELNARAFTRGNDIFFRENEYSTGSESGQKLIAHELTHTIQQGASSQIYRSVTGMITEKTHLRKPNSKGDAPRKLPKLFNMLKGALKPGDSIELLDTKSPADSPVWQMAKHPETGENGFLRLTKVLATGATPPTTEEAKEKLKLDKDKIDYKTQASLLASIIGGVGGVVGKVEDAQQKTLEAYIKDLWDKDPDKVRDLSKIADPGKTPKEVQDKAIEEWAKNNPDIVNTARGLTFGGLGVGAIGDVLSGFSSLFEIAQGSAKIKEGGFQKKTEGHLMRIRGVGGIGGALMGLGKKGGTALSTLAGDETGAGKAFSSIAEGFGALGGIIKVLKAPVDVVFVFFKGIRDAYNRSKKQVETKPGEAIKDAFTWLADLAKAAMGGVKGAFDTAKSVFAGIKTWWTAIKNLAKTLIGPIFGIVGAVLQLVTAAIDGIKLAINVITSIIKMVKDNETAKKIEDKDYQSEEKKLPHTIMNLPKSPQILKSSKSGKPSVVHLTDILNQYKEKPPEQKTEAANKNYEKAQNYLVDRNLVDILKKRLSRAYSHIAEWIFDGLSILNSVAGALTTIILEIVSIAAAPTGVGFAIAQAAKSVSGIVFGAIGVILQVIKGVYSFSRWSGRGIKQLGREVGAKLGIKGLKTKSWKHEKRVNDTIAIMNMVADLADYDPADKESKGIYERVQLRLKAIGVDFRELYTNKDKPLKQAELIYQAMAKRE